MNRKAQSKMMESVMVMVVFFILLMMGLGFYAYTKMTTVSQEASQTTSLESIAVAQEVNYLPELACYRQGVLIENCIDIYKAKAFGELMNQSTDNKLFYFDRFKHSKIDLAEIYPENSSIVMYDYSEGNREGRATNIPITIWDPVKDTNSFAIMSIRYRR